MGVTGRGGIRAKGSRRESGASCTMKKSLTTHGRVSGCPCVALLAKDGEINGFPELDLGQSECGFSHGKEVCRKGNLYSVSKK